MSGEFGPKTNSFSDPSTNSIGCVTTSSPAALYGMTMIFNFCLSLFYHVLFVDDLRFANGVSLHSQLSATDRIQFRHAHLAIKQYLRMTNVHNNTIQELISIVFDRRLRSSGIATMDGSIWRRNLLDQLVVKINCIQLYAPRPMPYRRLWREQRAKRLTRNPHSYGALIMQTIV